MSGKSEGKSKAWIEESCEYWKKGNNQYIEDCFTAEEMRRELSDFSEALTAAAKRVEEVERKASAWDAITGMIEAHCQPEISESSSKPEAIDGYVSVYLKMKAEIASLTSQLASLKAVAGELVQAMVDYQMDVDEEPPRKHLAMMQRAREALTATTNGEGE
jgi:hypothetical protein